jgi:hypothetical protein
MNRISMGILSGVLLAGLIGCQRAGEDDAKRHGEVMEKLGSIEKRLETLEKRPAAGGPMQPGMRARPDPNTVYYVPVDANDLVRGDQHAKVVVAEAFEFA